MTLFPLIYYQGLCHKCQKGFYYPGGDRFAKSEDKRELKCVVCNYPERKKYDSE